MMNDIARIRQVVRTTAFDEALAEHLGLNATDLRCFELLVAEPGVTPSHLAERSGLTTGAVTGVLDRLEKAGYVERRPDPADRRSVTVRPAPARAADIVDALAPLQAAIVELLQGCTPEERVAIGRFLDGAGRLVADETARLRAQTRGGFVGDTFRAPLGGSVRGRLVFASGAPRFALNIAPLGPRASARIIAETSASRLEFTGATPAEDLVVASFDGPRPDVRSAGGVVTIRYRRQAIAAFATRMAHIALSGAVPWTLELDGGITDLTGSLDGVTLERLDIEGGANHVSLDLPRPHGTAAVRVNGVASSARFRRPAGVPVAVRLAGGISRLQVDGRSRADVAGKRRYVGDGFDERPDRYELEILGGASEVIVSER
jgi:DNA-binding MarR family transcriptional regulator